MSNKKQILVVEDESSIADNIIFALESEGFAVTWYSLGQQALLQIETSPVDLVILDVGLPDISGFEVCKSIRQISDVPIIFLTARGDEIDRVVGLEIGGDDYVVKPFSPRELVARVKVRLKRSMISESRPDNIRQPDALIGLQENRFQVEADKRQILFCGKPLDLTFYEFGLLQLLLCQPERVFTREQLLERVWNEPQEALDRVVDTHIKAIRAKLRAISPQDSSIVTHRGVGYSIQVNK